MITTTVWFAIVLGSWCAGVNWDRCLRGAREENHPYARKCFFFHCVLLVMVITEFVLYFLGGYTNLLGC
jgi:hypothetical protein